MVSAISEDAEATSAAEAGFDTTTNEEATAVGGVAAEATADEGVGGDAEALDRSAKDEGAIEFVVLAVRGEDAVAALPTVKKDEEK